MVDQELLPEVFEKWKGSGTPTFRLDLPVDPRSAADYLDQLQTQVRDSTNILDTAIPRLGSLANRFQSQVEKTSEYWISGLPDPEAEVLLLMAEINRRTRIDNETGLSFRLENLPLVNLDLAVSQFQEATARLFQFIGTYAWVETRLQGALIGRTVIHPGGSMDILCSQPSPSLPFELQQRSLTLAVASRIFLFRMFCVAFQGAGLLSTFLTPSPFYVALALSVTWRFASRLCSEVK